ncbi:MAG: NADH-quinone oxidoreductase subunit NuoN [Alphaproteobacteria bacterium]|nr:NADH-quinone oxidoreductase subunit NuoN [Alphaproteobacteria bacterium]
MTAAPDFLIVLPEMFLGGAAMLLLLAGVYAGTRATRFVSWLSVLALVATLAILLQPVWSGGAASRQVGLFGMFISDSLGVFTQTLVIIGSILSLLIAIRFNENEGIARIEFPVLMLISTAGMMMMIAANDLISLYLSLELQSLALYVLAAFARDDVRSTEAGLKYFVLGAVASGMLLFGASMVYGFAGTTSFDGLAKLFAGGAGNGVGLITGIVFISVGLAFKVSAVPFHMWTPDVYEGAPTPVTAFFSVAPKIAALTLFLRVMLQPFGSLSADWLQIIWAISFASMAWGAFAAIAQSNIKRLMAYSSIGHVGYALIGLAAGSAAGVRGVLVYLAIYLFMNAGTFAVILCMRRDGKMVEGIDDLAGLSRTHPALALALAIFMFSLAGIPPLAGFFAKLYVFIAAIDAGLPVLAVLGVLTSVVGAYYYLRIVKVMYFDEARGAFDRPFGGEVTVVVLVCAVIIMFFIVWPGPLLNGADAVAATLFPG